MPNQAVLGIGDGSHGAAERAFVSFPVRPQKGIFEIAFAFFE